MSKAPPPAPPPQVAEPPARWLVGAQGAPLGPVLVDSGPLLALFNAADDWHAPVAAWLRTYPGALLVSTWPVLTETTHLMNARLSSAVAARFLGNVADGFCAIHALDPAEIRRIAELMRKYAKLPMDLADASLLLLAEHLGDGRILSTDQRDFRTYRFKNHQPFRNLLLPD